MVTAVGNKGWKGNFFEDFTLGEAWTCPVPRRVTDGDVAAYIALTGDRTAPYCGAASRVHPLITFHVVFSQTVRQISLNARANLGYAQVVWHAPVFVGDVLSTQFRVIGLRENASKETGIVYVSTEGFNQHGALVLSFARWVMIKKRSIEPTAYLDSPHVPTLPAAVNPGSLRGAEALGVDPSVTAGWYRFADYSPGERIFHHDAMALNASDHMAFTRLFQNSAKVHFDAHGMAGRPLVYGGVVISQAYALALNGLENRVGIAAINGGTHAAPSYAGDTLYAFSDVLDVAPLSDEVGAVRLRLLVTKNHDPAAEPVDVTVDDPSRPGKTRLNPLVVLDLDYWELVLR